MHDERTRLLGLEGFGVRAVREKGHELDLEVELVSPPVAALAAGGGAWR